MKDRNEIDALWEARERFGARISELDLENGRLTGTVLDLQRAMRHALAHLDQILGSRHAEDARAVLRHSLEQSGGLPPR